LKQESLPITDFKANNNGSLARHDLHEAEFKKIVGKRVPVPGFWKLSLGWAEEMVTNNEFLTKPRAQYDRTACKILK